MPEKIVIASGNAGKLAEFANLFSDWTQRGVQLIGQRELNITDPDETGHTFVENALIKARNAARRSGAPAIADDSGICVDALRGAPGLISAHYAGTHGDAAGNIAKLLTELVAVPLDQRQARFVCVMVYLAHADDPMPLIAQAAWEGRIATTPSGVGGFGYDPIFIDGQSGLSAASLDSAHKNRISHRGQAAQQLRALLEHRIVVDQLAAD